MYMADMYCYGKDANCVGVTGIRECIGVFVSYGNILYAIHIPNMVEATNDMGRQAFNTYVRGQVGMNYDGANASMVAVANGAKNRLTAEDETKTLGRLMGIGRFVMFRPSKYVHMESSNTTSSISVLWERQGDNSLLLKYRNNFGVNYQKDAGAARDGIYKFNPDYMDDNRFSASTNGWFEARPPNGHGIAYQDC